MKRYTDILFLRIYNCILVAKEYVCISKTFARIDAKLRKQLRALRRRARPSVDIRCFVHTDLLVFAVVHIAYVAAYRVDYME